MESTLIRIKRLVLHNRVFFTVKAKDEMELDVIAVDEVLEALLNAKTIKKTMRSRSPFRHRAREKIYVIESFTFSGRLLYTKGVIRDHPRGATLYILVSSKRSTHES